MLIRLCMLESAMWADLPQIREDRGPGGRSRPALPGPALLTSATQLALCTGVAYAALFYLPVPRGYWIALTVALVMKPDLGSVFSRAVLRSVGTVAGAAIAVLVGLVIDGPAATAVVIGIVAAFLPWGMARSYLWQAIFMVPLIMWLINLVAPAESLRTLSEARLSTTIIGGLIVIIFGYLIWPSMRRPQIAREFNRALTALASYAKVVADGAAPAQVTASRRDTYRKLADTRVHLQRNLSEPPPAGADAWSWIPVVAGAERVADRITAASASRTPTSGDDIAAVAATLETLSHGVTPASGHLGQRTPTPPSHGGQAADPSVREMADELAHLGSMLTRGGPSQPEAR
ncbi:FUSC family protein [Gordonia sp. VNK1]|uniref:FUSC family protein n=1 Tax=Gordonia oleivorans TaxID=3156618 RepID=UPI0032B39156